MLPKDSAGLPQVSWLAACCLESPMVKGNTVPRLASQRTQQAAPSAGTAGLCTDLKAIASPDPGQKSPVNSVG